MELDASESWSLIWILSDGYPNLIDDINSLCSFWTSSAAESAKVQLRTGHQNVITALN
jgi:hypothetical protein